MENTNYEKRPTMYSRLGLITGALLLGLGLYAVIFKPGGANPYLAYFMIAYGGLRLGVALYSSYLRKKNPVE